MITEPTTSRSAPRHVLVARLVTPLWGGSWVFLKLINKLKLNPPANFVKTQCEDH